MTIACASFPAEMVNDYDNYADQSHIARYYWTWNPACSTDEAVPRLSAAKSVQLEASIAKGQSLRPYSVPVASVNLVCSRVDGQASSHSATHPGSINWRKTMSSVQCLPCIMGRSTVCGGWLQSQDALIPLGQTHSLGSISRRFASKGSMISPTSPPGRFTLRS